MNWRLRHYRLSRGWSLEDLANEIVQLGTRIDERNLGVTGNTVGRWERGERRPRPPYPKLLCALFNVSAEDLGLHESNPEFFGRLEQSIAVERLSGSGLKTLPSLYQVERQIIAVHALYQEGDYRSASVALPGLIEATAALHDTEPVNRKQRVFAAQAWIYVAAAKLATKLGDASAARLAADHALTAATFSASPHLMGAAYYQLACAFNRAGELDNAQEAACGAVDQLAHDLDEASPILLSVRGALLLIAAVVAARRGDRQESARQLAEAERMADLLGVDGNYAWTAFGPTNVRTHALAVAISLGDVDRAIEIGSTIEPQDFPSGLVGRRCQVHFDMAWAYIQRCDNSEAVIHLLLAERTGPQVLKHNPKARRLVQDLLERERGIADAGLRYLAHQLGMDL